MTRKVAILIGYGAMLSGSIALQPAMAQPQHDWSSYGNARFEFIICYPTDLLKPGRESDNGDGRDFLAKDGARMSVWGTPNTLDLTPAQVLAKTVGDIEREGGEVRYKVTKGDWYVASGTLGGQIFYQRSTSNTVRFASFRLTYPKEQAAIWKPVVARLSACLDGDPQTP